MSVVSGLDFVDDGRGLAVVDWDHDGDLDLWLSNRTAPRLRFMRNDIRSPTSFAALKLRGTTCNRDAIGARVELELTDPAKGRLVQTLIAGDGFLSQSSKWLHFGLGDGQIRQVVVRWPGGEAEVFSGVASGGRYELVQGSGRAVEWLPPKRSVVLRPSRQKPPEPVPTSHVLLPTSFPLPVLPYTGFDRSTRRVIESRPLLVNFWASWCVPCVAELEEFAGRERDLRAAGLDVLSLSVDGMGQDDTTGPTDAANLLKEIGFPFEGGMATVELLDKLERVQRFLLDRRPAFAVPLSILLDRDGHLAAIYRGRVPVERLLRDVKSLDVSPKQRRDLSVPFTGTWLEPPTEVDLSLAAAPFYDHYPNDTLLYLELALKQQEPLLDQYRDSAQNRTRVDRTRATIHHKMAVCLKRLGRPADAIEHCRKSLSIDPDQAPLQLVLGELLSDQSQLEQAIAPLEAALGIDPTLTEAQFRLGLVHGQLGHFEQATELFEMVIAAQADYPDAHLVLAAALEQLGRFSEAIEQFRQAVVLNPDQDDGHRKLGMALAKQGQYDEAIIHLKEFLRLRPNAFNGHYVLGRLLVKVGRVDEALEALGQAQRLKPEWPAPLNSKAWILATHPDPAVRDEPEAIRLAEQAAALTDRRAANVLHTLAAAYAAAGHYDRAVATAQQALELGSDNPEFADRMRGQLELYKKGKPYRQFGPAPTPED